jgi:hypothetical protein
MRFDTGIPVQNVVAPGFFISDVSVIGTGTYAAGHWAGSPDPASNILRIMGGSEHKEAATA